MSVHKVMIHAYSEEYKGLGRHASTQWMHSVEMGERNRYILCLCEWLQCCGGSHAS